MNSVDKLTKIFSEFPGIGPKQARRIIYFLLSKKGNNLNDISNYLLDLKKEIYVCKECMRFFQKKHDRSELCDICSDQNRKKDILMILERDVDLESVEKSGEFEGIYFVLGGSLPILEKEPEKKIRIRELLNFLDKKAKKDLKEIILGFNWNPEGENTAYFIENKISPIINKYNIKISHLGKGLSMGTEIEYADKDTLKNALKNRS